MKLILKIEYCDKLGIKLYENIYYTEISYEQLHIMNNDYNLLHILKFIKDFLKIPTKYFLDIAFDKKFIINDTMNIHSILFIMPIYVRKLKIEKILNE